MCYSSSVSLRYFVVVFHSSYLLTLHSILLNIYFGLTCSYFMFFLFFYYCCHFLI